MHFLSLSSVIVVVGLFITINLSVILLHHQCSYFLPFAIVSMQYFRTPYSTDALKTRDVEAVIFQQLPLPLTKSEKTTVDNFF